MSGFGMVVRVRRLLEELGHHDVGQALEELKMTRGVARSAPELVRAIAAWPPEVPLGGVAVRGGRGCAKASRPLKKGEREAVRAAGYTVDCAGWWRAP